MILNIIEEIADGLVILNEKKEILFFNEVFLRITGWRAMDLLGDEKKFLKGLKIENLEEGSYIREISDSGGNASLFRLKSFRVQAQGGYYYLVSVKPEASETREIYREYYEQLFNNIGDAIVIAELSGRVLTHNSAFISLMGGDKESIPENLTEIYIYRDQIDDKLQKLLHSGVVYNLETHLYNTQGAMKRVIDSSWVVKNGDGTVKRFVSIFRDITYLRNIESRLLISERNYTILFDTILSSIILLDTEGTILNLNSAAEKVYGYGWEEMVGLRYDDHFRIEKKQPSFAKIIGLTRMNDGTHIIPEIKRLRKNGEEIYTYAVITAVRNSTDEIVAYSMVEKDLTERVHLENKLRESFNEIRETQSAAILGFAKLTEYRDKDTGKHLERIREYTRILAAALRKLPKYEDYIKPEYIEDLCLSSTLHDIGKVGVEDNLLLKRGKLSKKEFTHVKNHAMMGGDALGTVDSTLHKKSFLTLGKEIAYFHHERWDGKGYPQGLKGDAIPLSARIVAVSDVYDALTSKRPYKDAYPHNKAVEIIVSERGKQFDPDIVDAFMENQEVFERVRRFIEFQEHPEKIFDLLEKQQDHH